MQLTSFRACVWQTIDNRRVAGGWWCVGNLAIVASQKSHHLNGDQWIQCWGLSRNYIREQQLTARVTRSYSSKYIDQVTVEQGYHYHYATQHSESVIVFRNSHHFLSVPVYSTTDYRVHVIVASVTLCNVMCDVCNECCKWDVHCYRSNTDWHLTSAKSSNLNLWWPITIIIHLTLNHYLIDTS